MIFNFLRQYLKDDEFEQNKIELSETRAVLQEYKNFIQEQKESEKNEGERVDPDFLVMVWASVGLAITMCAQASTQLPKSEAGASIPIMSLSFEQLIWLAFALIALAFFVINIQFALNLTLAYTRSKSNHGYKTYAYSLLGGITLIVIGFVLMVIIR